MTQICFATTIFIETNFSVPKNIKHSIWFLVVSTTRIKLRMSIESREEFKNGMLAHRPVALANNVTTKNTREIFDTNSSKPIQLFNDDCSRQTIVVWFSCGAASAVAAKKTIEKYGHQADIKIVNNPILEEDEDNRRFLNDVQEWLNHPIEIAKNANFPDCSAKTVWHQRRYMSGVVGAPCTTVLKKQARQQWENENYFTDIVLGFTFDEVKRHERFILSERSNVLPVLINEKITKDDCFNIIKTAGIELPRMYKMGYPNANCIGCVKSTSPSYWNHVRKMHPEVFKERADQSRHIGAKLVRYKGQRIMLDELPANAIGRPLKQIPGFDCGIFCEEHRQANDNNANEIEISKTS